MEEKIAYQGEKDFVYDGMNGQYHDDNPISYGSGFVIDYSLLLHDPSDAELMCCFIACGLYELEQNDLEDRIEEQMTYWIYQVKKGKFDNLISDIDVLKDDIKKIESMMTLRFEDLECYEADE